MLHRCCYTTKLFVNNNHTIRKSNKSYLVNTKIVPEFNIIELDEKKLSKC